MNNSLIYKINYLIDGVISTIISRCQDPNFNGISGIETYDDELFNIISHY